jgi:cytidine deaminase
MGPGSAGPAVVTGVASPQDARVCDAARQALSSSYSPYSRFPVGAALLAADGRIFSGANVENSSYGLTMCAERVALYKAVTEGSRDLVALALTAGSGRPVTPCGACRQVLAEFCADLPILVLEGSGHVARFSLAALLPSAFSRADLT